MHSVAWAKLLFYIMFWVTDASSVQSNLYVNATAADGKQEQEQEQGKEEEEEEEE